MSLYTMLTAVILLSGLTMVGLTAIYHTPSGRKRHIRDGPHGTANAKNFVTIAAFNAGLSMGLVYALTWWLRPFVFVEGPAFPLRVLAEGIAILLLYDFLYYLLHRYAFHEWRVLRRVHAVHHVVRNPSAIDSLYMHPIEGALGLGLLWGCAAVLALVTGRVSAYSFGWAFLVYSVLNVLIHSGLRVERFPGSLLTGLATRHDAHHRNMKSGNFASVTPFWDASLGTEESPRF